MQSSALEELDSYAKENQKTAKIFRRIAFCWLPPVVALLILFCGFLILRLPDEATKILAGIFTAGMFGPSFWGLLKLAATYDERADEFLIRRSSLSLLQESMQKMNPDIVQVISASFVRGADIEIDKLVKEMVNHLNSVENKDKLIEEVVKEVINHLKSVENKDKLIEEVVKEVINHFNSVENEDQQAKGSSPTPKNKG